MNKCFLLIALLFTVGCNSPSMNLQRSSARDFGDTGITVYLDDRDINDVDEKKERILAIVMEIENFLNSGEIGQLTINSVKKQINEIVPNEYQNISNMILEYLSGYTVPTDRIPINVVRNMKATLKGIKVGVNEYSIEDRKQFSEVK